MADQLRVCYPPDPNPRRPAYRAPPGTCDTHFHVFGPPDRFPYSAARVYTPPAAPVEHFLTMAGIIGVERGVVVQPNAHGTDNAVSLDAIARSGGRLRGMAKLDDASTDAEIARLHEGGFRGVRFTLVPELGGRTDLSMFTRVIDRVKGHGWCVDFHVLPDALVEHAAWFRTLPVPVIIDHYGRVDFRGGVGQKPFQVLLGLARDERIWVKISGSDRQSATGAPYEDAIPFAHALAEVAPERLLWGTDWPHSSIFRPGTTPNDGVLMDLVPKLLPEPALQEAALAKNPARLFGFDG